MPGIEAAALQQPHGMQQTSQKQIETHILWLDANITHTYTHTRTHTCGPVEFVAGEIQPTVLAIFGLKKTHSVFGANRIK